MNFFEAMEQVRACNSVKRPYMPSPLSVFDVFMHDSNDMIEVPRTGARYEHEIPGWFPSVVCDSPYNFPEEDIVATDWEVVS